MTTKQLREWLFEHSLEDQWWVSLDGVTEDVVMTLAEAEARARVDGYADVRVLHVTQGEMESPPWVEVDKRGKPREAIPAELMYRSDVLGFVMLVIPVAAIGLAVLWLSNLSPFSDWRMPLWGIVAATIVGTGVLAGLEMERCGQGKKGASSVGWAFVVICLWALSYPAYLAYRSKFGLRNLGPVAVVVMLGFVGGLGILDLNMSVQAHEAAEEARMEAEARIHEMTRRLQALDW